jgi:hypothetical protein
MSQVSLRSIKFNHDTSAFSKDALNIRRNATTGVSIPEWQNGVSVRHEDSRAAYAIRETKGNTLTIQASFAVAHPEDFPSLDIRAVDPAPGASWPKWLIILYLLLLILLHLPIPFNILGRVKERTVSFKSDGTSDFVTFELQNVLLWGIAFLGLKKGIVGKFDVTWRWQWRPVGAGTWTDFEHSRHRIYAILEEPKAPWGQGGNSPDSWPWTDALELACGWSIGTTNRDEAATAITRGINSHPLQRYTPATTFVSFPDNHYLLTSYVNALNGSSQFVLNCTDCADAVTTFANLLGCNLHEGTFGSMKTRRFLPLNGNPSVDGEWVWWNWGYHEICWVDQMGENEFVYDGCLQLDMDDNYGDTVHTAKLPANMRFGKDDPNDYRYRLVEIGPADLNPQEPNRSVM